VDRRGEREKEKSRLAGHGERMGSRLLRQASPCVSSRLLFFCPNSTSPSQFGNLLHHPRRPSQLDPPIQPQTATDAPTRNPNSSCQFQAYALGSCFVFRTSKWVYIAAMSNATTEKSITRPDSLYDIVSVALLPTYEPDSFSSFSRPCGIIAFSWDKPGDGRIGSVSWRSFRLSRLSFVLRVVVSAHQTPDYIQTGT
jgi:hypothetical protein